jgi:hypothetical protein
MRVTIHSFRAGFFLIALAGGLLLLPACDSGGSNGDDSESGGESPVEVTNALDGDLTIESTPDNRSANYEVDEIETQDGTTDIDGFGNFGTTPIDIPDVDEIGDENDPEGFDEFESSRRAKALKALRS